MTIILFLVDTSASMCQKAYINGVQKNYLDIAKSAVEIFLKYRQRTQDCLGDRYMLLTFEDPPANVKAGWKENHATFMNELKNLQCNGLTSMGEALKNALDLLNLNRMQSGIDTYGQGRCPFYLESSVIIAITDGGKYSYRSGVHQEMILPLNSQVPGTKFTKEPFRWDQRFFALVLRMGGSKGDDRMEGKVPHDDSHIERMCEVTGGRSYRIKSHHILNQCIESLVQKIQPGVVLHFEPYIPKELKDGEMQDISFQAMKKMIFVMKNPTQKAYPVGYWPLPESFWPDSKSTTLPPRDAHPKIRVMSPSIDEPQILRNFPVDKYEMEPSALTLQILSKREPNKCWPVCISNGLHVLEVPFGFLKANQSFTQVYLFVLAYNYPLLLPLLYDLFHKFLLNPPNEWMYKFNAYVRSLPQYYCPFLRRALGTLNVPPPLLQFMLPENMDNFLSPNVANYLKQMKNTAKQDQENLCLRVYKILKQIKPPYRQIETTKLNVNNNLRRDPIRNPMLKETFNKVHHEIVTFDNYTIVVPSLIPQISVKNYRNPFDIVRRDLIDEVSRMSSNFIKAFSSGFNLTTKDSGHCLPISEMGNYQEYLKNKESPLREIEPTNVRQHMFGNPYKKDKHMVMVDEADLGEVAPVKTNTSNILMKKNESNARMNRKRKAGPIRKDFIFRRLSDDSSSVKTSPSRSDVEDDISVASDDWKPDLFEFQEPEDLPFNGNSSNYLNCELEKEADATELKLGSYQVVPITFNNNFANIQNNIAESSVFSNPCFDNQVSEPFIVQNINSHNELNSISTNANLNNRNDLNDPEEISKILQQCRIESVDTKLAKKIDMLQTDENSEADVISPEQYEIIKKQNLKTRSIVFKDIRKLGHNYSDLLDHLSLVQGNLETKSEFIQMCVYESLRFRRKKMAKCIREWWNCYTKATSDTEGF
ncbi:integrator complex subunit 6 [Condylostylus longicornis]|uniref:integrator complex subunit 6 n=1 Tax=Condylostylus longicornis TaxID=2530218 RepID=UPI00244DB3E4|nr:integrator complex subunit 6 [Condylostylus longicornis]